ncbi:expressed unknown protein [Ectocarpus siliculosus]|uniref:Uncharacterized protein n=1 Tax=Ectocarpus siliculosus TaxID=2880 RepID=D7FNC5_ECTSI|nr:expressed unknown protein [Ectocarpus siliculosus]|eukprot:CBJ34260.1 expressed unknown protein [Ectocarpus siliculosus]
MVAVGEGWSRLTRQCLSSASRERSRPPSEGAVVAMYLRVPLWRCIRRDPVVLCSGLPLALG